MYKNSTSNNNIILIIFLLIICLFIRSCASNITYNNGVCPYCGGNYIYSQAVGHRHHTSYIYICDTCGRSIEVAEYYKENKDEITTK